MILRRTYWVTPAGEDAPYFVTLATREDGWEASIRRGEESWTYRLAPGPDRDRVWVGDAPQRCLWKVDEGGAGTLTLNGTDHRLHVEDEIHHRLAAVNPRGPASSALVEVRAPMPGLLLRLEVKPDDTVQAGDTIAIIEAMKMENEITASIAGHVRDLAVQAGQAVDGGRLLCRIQSPAVDRS